MTTFIVFLAWWAIGTAILFSPEFFKDAQKRITVLTFVETKRQVVLILLLFSIAFFPVPMLAPFFWLWGKIKEFVFLLTLRVFAWRISKMAQRKDSELKNELEQLADKMKGK